MGGSDKDRNEGTNKTSFNKSAAKSAITKLIKIIRDLLVDREQSGQVEVLIEEVKIKLSTLKEIVLNQVKDLEGESRSSELEWLEDLEWSVQGTIMQVEKWIGDISDDRTPQEPPVEAKVNIATSTLKTDSIQQHQIEAKEKVPSIESGLNPTLVEHLLRSHLPPLKVPVFDGKPENYNEWVGLFENIIEARTHNYSERFMYLKQYLHQEGKDLVSGFEATAANYEKAKAQIRYRYYHPFKVARALIDGVLQAAPRWSEPSSVNTFSALIMKCKNAMADGAYVQELNTADNLRKLANKLPYSIRNRWIRNAYELHEKGKMETFSDFSDFIQIEAQIATDPVYTPEPEKQGKRVSTLTTRVECEDKSQMITYTANKCFKCEQNHKLKDCKVFAKGSYPNRRQFVMEHGLCWLCLLPGHRSSACINPEQCRICRGKHPTSMHREFDQHNTEVRANKITNPKGQPNDESRMSGSQDYQGHKAGESIQISSTCLASSSEDIVLKAIVPVRVFHESDNTKFKDVYALLDNGSNGSFISRDLVSELDIPEIPTTLELSTMSGQSVFETSLIKGLKLKQVNTSTSGDSKEFTIPKAFVRKGIPANYSEIAKPSDVKKWPHLKGLYSEIPELEKNMKIGLLIGSNCPRIIEPKAVITGPSGPYATLSPFGWVIVGPIGGQSSATHFVSCNDTVIRELPPNGSFAPVKQMQTMPRLELSAAALCARAGTLVVKELNYEDDIQQVFWTDPTSVLRFINNEARRFHTFIANRVQQIRNKTEPKQWRYISTNLNPADDASHGLRMDSFIKSKRWFQGPTFLNNSKKLRNDQSIDLSLDPNDCEVKHCVLTTDAIESISNFLIKRFERFSDWYRLTLGISVIKAKKGGLPASKDAISVEERKFAEKRIINSYQYNYLYIWLPPENKKSSISRLDPFLDDDHIVRVGGRLDKTSISYALKHPIVLPSKCHLTELIIRHYHTNIHHRGRNFTLSEIKESGFWIIKGNSAVRNYISRCVRCRHLRGCEGNQKMADIPEDRAAGTLPPFTYCAVDHFGPFYVKQGRKQLKRYGVLFTCMASRSVHIEVSPSMETEAFINALRRFICRRVSNSLLEIRSWF